MDTTPPGAVKAPATARAVGTVAGRTWRHLGSFLVLLGLTWCHSVSLGVTRFHSDLVLRHSVSLGVTWCHLVSHGFTWCHLVSLRPHSVSLGVTWCHFRVTRFRSVSLGFAETGFSWILGFVPAWLVFARVYSAGRTEYFFSLPRKKRPLGVTWIHFFAKKQVFQEVAEEVRYNREVLTTLLTHKSLRVMFFVAYGIYS